MNRYLQRDDVVYIPSTDIIGVVEHMEPIFDEEGLSKPIKFVVMIDDYKSSKNKKKLDKSWTRSVLIEKKKLTLIGTL